MAADPLQYDRDICAYFIKVMSVRYSLLIFKEVLVPADGVNTSGCLVRMFGYEAAASADDFINGGYVFQIHLVQSFSILHEVKVAVIETRYHCSAAAVVYYVIRLRHGQDLIAAADG